MLVSVRRVVPIVSVFLYKTHISAGQGSHSSLIGQIGKHLKPYGALPNVSYVLICGLSIFSL